MFSEVFYPIPQKRDLYQSTHGWATNLFLNKSHRKIHLIEVFIKFLIQKDAWDHTTLLQNLGKWRFITSFIWGVERWSIKKCCLKNNLWGVSSSGQLKFGTKARIPRWSEFCDYLKWLQPTLQGNAGFVGSKLFSLNHQCLMTSLRTLCRSNC